MAENSDYENFKFENEKAGVLTFVIIVVLWPIGFFLYFNFLEGVLPFWFAFILILVLPFVASHYLKRWIDRNAP
jgi:hypothetical protein